jgi:hypothetical protein
MFLLARLKKQFVPGLSPIPALTCPDTPELGLLRSRPAQSIAMAMDFGPAPAFSRICPASVSRMTASGIPVQYAG